MAEADTLDQKSVDYINESGQSATATATLVTADDTVWGNGWYVAEDSIEISRRVTVMGEVNLILTDDCSLTFTDGIDVYASNRFTIYAQSGGTGALSASGGDNEAGIGGRGGTASDNIGSGGEITINGGTVTATSGNGGAGIGGGTGIGGGANGASGSFSTGAGGTAIIYADSIADQSGKNDGTWSGIIFENGEGVVYGDQSLSSDFVLEAGQTLTIRSGSSLTNTIKGKLTIKGTLTNEGTLTINGTLSNQGTFNNNGPVTVPMTGTFSNSGTLNCTYHSYESGICVICKAIAVSGIQLEQSLNMGVGSTATLRATVSPADASNKTLA